MIEDSAREDLEFGAAYADLMSRPLDQRLFVKNIENVQGDERDHIVFSIGYGPGIDGRVRANFGVLNRAGGENRLNVAISRARQRVHVFCSADPEDLQVGGARNPGPKHLKWYLQYARAVGSCKEEEAERTLRELHGGPLIPDGGAQTLVFDTNFEEQVHSALTDCGYTVDTQIGASGYRIDLAVRHPDSGDRYALGVECDGATYHSARSVRERDVFRQAFLESRGWTIARVWSRNWWRNPGGEVSRICGLIEAQRRRPQAQQNGEMRDQPT